MIINTFPLHTLKKDIRKATITVRTQGMNASNPSQYDGQGHWPAATVIYNGATLTEGVDYTLTYQTQVNAGDYPVTITGIGDFRESVTETWTISRKMIIGSFGVSPESLSRTTRTDLLIYAGIPSQYAESFEVIVSEAHNISYGRTESMPGTMPTLTLKSAYATLGSAYVIVSARSQNYILGFEQIYLTVVS